MGDLHSEIQNSIFLEVPIKVKAIQSYVWTIANVLASVHSKIICHRDIKPQNIVIDIGSDCSLIDFGISKELKKADFDQMTTGVKGTLQYLAPELMKKKARDLTFIDLFKCDMWAFGILLYQIVYYSLPFEAEEKSKYKQQVIDPSYEIKYSQNFFDTLI